MFVLQQDNKRSASSNKSKFKITTIFTWHVKERNAAMFFIHCQYHLIIITIKVNVPPTRFHWIPMDNDNT